MCKEAYLPSTASSAAGRISSCWLAAYPKAAISKNRAMNTRTEFPVTVRMVDIDLQYRQTTLKEG